MEKKKVNLRDLKPDSETQHTHDDGHDHGDGSAFKTYISTIISFVMLILFGNSFAQNPNVQNILNDVKIDSMTFFVEQLTGEEPVIIGGNPDIITSRYKNNPGNEKAFQFIKEKFSLWG